MRDTVNSLAARVGADPLLVQGAGGNISWKDKDNDSIFVKASGTWLAEASQRNIYVEMDLKATRQKIAESATDYLPAMRGEFAGLYPSIETALHALLPQQVVLHLHPVDVIALSVMPDAIETIATLLDGLDWEWIDYVKPGMELANAMASKIAHHDVVPNIWILANHGIVIAEESVDAVDVLLGKVMAKLQLPVRALPEKMTIAHELNEAWEQAGYQFIEDALIASLARDDRTLNLCRDAWVLYPDHAVFLGGRCHFADSPQHVDEADAPRVVIIVPHIGVCIKKDAPSVTLDMLRCYANVLLRLPDDMPNILSPESVAELLNWDAEKIRQNMQTKN